MRVVSQEKYFELSQYMSKELLEKNFKCHQPKFRVVEETEITDWNSIEVSGVPMLKSTTRIKLQDLAEGFPCIYQMIDNKTNRVIYVGQAQCAYKRFTTHELARGRDIRFEILETRELEELGDRLEWEAIYIRRRLSEKEPLLNNCHVVEAYRKKK